MRYDLEMEESTRTGGPVNPFPQPHYTSQKFQDIIVHTEIFEAVQFQDCAFTGCDLSECTFKNCQFEACTFTSCDLSLAKLPLTQFKSVTFKDCRLMGINWCNAYWGQKSLLLGKHVDFSGCLLDHSIFIGLNLTDTSFKRCKARHLDFESANLTRADFSGADLEITRFIHCDLTDATFVGASNYQINAAENTLHQTHFSLPEAVALLHSLDIVLEE